MHAPTARSLQCQSIPAPALIPALAVLFFAHTVGAGTVNVLRRYTADNLWRCGLIAADCSGGGTLAVLVEDSYWGTSKLREIHPGGSVVESTFTGYGNVLYDSADALHVFMEYAGRVSHYQRSGEGWTPEAIPGKLGYNGNVTVAPDDTFHLSWSSWNGPLQYASNASGSWQTETVVPFNGTELMLLGLAADSAGAIHVLYMRGQDVRYATNTSGSWQTEQVYRESDWPSDGSCTTVPYYTDVRFAVLADGTPFIIARHVQRVTTCSFVSSVLHCLTRQTAGSWAQQTIAVSSDNFYGPDGNSYTGFFPQVDVDDAGHVHILFSDAYFRHDPHQERQCGQVRHVLNRGQGWELETLMSQSPDLQHTETVNYGGGEQDVILRDLLQMRRLAVHPDGKRIHVVGLSMPSSQTGYDADLIHFTATRCEGLWCAAEDLGNGWRRLPWLGTFNVLQEPWIYHIQHRWMYPVGGSTNGLWFFTLDMGWLWTGESIAPNFYWLDGATWLFYNRFTSEPRLFYNYAVGRWEQQW